MAKFMFDGKEIDDSDCDISLETPKLTPEEEARFKKALGKTFKIKMRFNKQIVMPWTWRVELFGIGREPFSDN